MEKLKVKNDTLEARKIGEGRLFLWDEEKKSEKKKRLEKREREVSKKVCMGKRQGWFSRVNGGFSMRGYKGGMIRKEMKRLRERMRDLRLQAGRDFLARRKRF